MKHSELPATLLVAAAFWAPGVPLLAQEHADLPTGVTTAMVSAGESYFRSVGLCFACHGMDAKGIQGVGADLTDDEWHHSDGSYESLVHQILVGVSPQESTKGVMMPPKGGSQITEEQARAIAGYVWSLSHRPRTGHPGS